MHIGLIIYGSLDTLTGGYLYDRLLVEHLRRQGDQVDIISLPWRTYGRHLGDNFSRNLYGRLRHAPFDALLQDELNHPSLFWLNQRLRRSCALPHRHHRPPAALQRAAPGVAQSTVSLGGEAIPQGARRSCVQ